MDACGGNQTAAGVVRYLAAQPPPLCWIATPARGQRYAAGELALNITIDDITRSICVSQMVLGELESVEQDDLRGLARVTEHVGKYVKQAHRPEFKIGSGVPHVATELVDRFLAFWLEAYKKQFKRAYTLDDHDKNSAAQVLHLALRAARAEADEHGRVLGADAVEQRGVQIAAHWVTKYFADSREWIVNEHHKFKLLPKCLSTYGRGGGGAKKPPAPPEPEAAPMPLAPLRKATVDVGLPGTQGLVFTMPQSVAANGQTKRDP
jgi:hypothetical protein